MITIKNFRRFVIVSLIIGLSAAGLSVQSQTPQRTYVKQVLTRLEDHLDRFRNSIDDSGNVSSSNQSNDINDQVSDLTRTNDDLLDRLNNRTLNKSDVRAFVDRASRVDSFVANNQLSDRARTDWSVVSTDMRDLARSYSIPWTPRSAGYRPPSTSPGIGSNRVGSGVGVDSRLTGTFRLDQSASDNAQQAADRATNNMSSN
ncbi:MAG: hypothetical protein ACRD4L_05970, partial [Pyrinomonadaceae bacterium]